MRLHNIGTLRAAINRYGFLRYLNIQRHKVTSNECWFLAIRERRPGKFWEDPRAFNLIVAPQGGYYADPCLVKRGGTNYLFFEEYNGHSKKGTIACAIIDRYGTCTKPETVLQRDYHLSYPHIFEWQGNMYMVPESVSNRTIELYRAAEFPRKWELIRVLMNDIKAADTTLCLYRDRYWMFTNIASTSNSEPDNLCLFSSESPLGPWHAHPKNPIITDNSRSRPAGALFFNDGHLLRPSQDCSRDYGQAMWLNLITVLSDNEYDEEPIARINPGLLRGDVRTHTLSLNEDWEVRDGFRWIAKWHRQNESSRCDSGLDPGYRDGYRHAVDARHATTQAFTGQEIAEGANRSVEDSR